MGGTVAGCGRGPHPCGLLRANMHIVSAVGPVMRKNAKFVPKPFNANGAILRRTVSGRTRTSVMVVTTYNRHTGRIMRVFARFPRLISPRAKHGLVRHAVVMTGASGVPITTHRTSICATVAVTRFCHTVKLGILLVTSSASH